jgi:hypothetical protein
MTTYNKALIPGGDVSTIPEGTPLGISVLIQMPTAPWHPQRHHNPSSDYDDEIPLPELSIGVLDLRVAGTQEERPAVEVEMRRDEKWAVRDMEKGQAEAEVVHLEYRR